MLVNNSDRSEMAILKKKGASIDSYSIARSYQLKENLDLIKVGINYKIRRIRKFADVRTNSRSFHRLC